MVTRLESTARTREQLIAAADQVFVKSGFHGATVEAIAAAAGLTTGAVYSAFGGKAELFLAVVDRRLDERIAELHEYSKLPFGPERTKLAAEQFLDRIRREREWQIALLEFRLYAARNPDLTAAFANRHRRFVAAEAREGREDRPESESHLAAERAARAGIAIGNGYALERLTDPERATEEEFVRVAVILMQALEEAGGLD